MENGGLIGALAIFTIGAALVIGVLFFGKFLKDPENRARAKNALVDDGPVPSGRTSGKDDSGKPLKERLDDSEASAHPDDPARRKS